MPEDKGLSRSQREEKVLQFWKDSKVFEKTLLKKSPKGEFIFYEGPPTANGKPGIHHVEARAFKDAIPRYKTMRGFHVRRKAGWDTHGLPVELEVEKKLGLKSKKEIEEYGVEKFNDECKKSVWTYVDEWRRLSDRMGYWADYDNAYVTYHNPFMESIWTILSQIEKQNLLYKDYKVVPWCPRCGTTLSTHELAQGYKDVKDLTITAKFELVDEPGTYLLAWTTTPWTLPGNVGLAVGEKIEYVKAKIKNFPNISDGIYIFSKKDYENYQKLIEEEKTKNEKVSIEIVETFKGDKLVGLEYKPLYPFIKKDNKAFKVYSADFVNTEDGTGIVHTAVMYGQDDFELGTKVGLPKVHLVTPEGTFMKGTDWLEGRSVVDLPASSAEGQAGETLAVDILKDLQNRGLLFAKENYTHSYPFCWRCKTRLIYYARDSWYVKMSELRDKLVKENEKINWEPDYIKEGRFGEWLKEAKDWAISRERYWGTPLPIWLAESSTDGKDRIVVDSGETLKKHTKKSGNKYFVMRHGQAEYNVKGLLNCDPKTENSLTEEGKEAVTKSAQAIKNQKFTKIFCSQLPRAIQTAEIVKDILNLDVEIVLDERLNETKFGKFEGGKREDYRATFHDVNRFNDAPEGGETLNDMRIRMGGFLYEIEEKYSNENILIVSHGDPTWMMISSAYGYDSVKTLSTVDTGYLKTGEIFELPFVPLPHNKYFELDLHKPFIDGIILEKDGKEYKRVKEVMDVWFDSGSMPFSQDSDNREKAGDFSRILYPADFISEGLDQTRGWFYTMHAIGTLLNRGAAYKNVICLGLLLDKEGKKMSKSLGNVVDPFESIEKHGADAVRFWMYSINQPGDSKNFDDKTVDEVNKRVFNMLDNIYSFYDLFRDKSLENKNLNPKGTNILDEWIITRLSELTNLVTSKLDEYKLLEPTRAIRDFVDDLSTWYLRRSRDRIKDGEVEAKQTLYFVLKTVSKLLAPFTPFFAEELYQKLRTEEDLESVHLEDWPVSSSNTDDKIISKMNETRRIVSQGLEARAKIGIKIRQPLQSLSMQRSDVYEELIKDEINVKEIRYIVSEDVLVDSNITPELAEEGQVREIIRSIQEMRKEKNLKPADKIKHEVKENIELFKKYKSDIEKATNVEIVF